MLKVVIKAKDLTLLAATYGNIARTPGLTWQSGMPKGQMAFVADDVKAMNIALVIVEHAIGSALSFRAKGGRRGSQRFIEIELSPRLDGIE